MTRCCPRPVSTGCAAPSSAAVFCRARCRLATASTTASPRRPSRRVRCPANRDRTKDKPSPVLGCASASLSPLAGRGLGEGQSLRLQRFQHRLGAGYLELPRLLAVERLDDPVLDQHRVAVGTLTEAAALQV